MTPNQNYLDHFLAQIQMPPRGVYKKVSSKHFLELVTWDSLIWLYFKAIKFAEKMSLLVEKIKYVYK